MGIHPRAHRGAGPRLPTRARPTLSNGRPQDPRDVTPHLSWFDRFAGAASGAVSRAPFFAFCVLLIVLWLPTIVLFAIDTWQLIINTVTTIITFLLVALLQNSQTRADAALQKKLNAIARALADFMQELAGEHPALSDDQERLRAAIGLELRESS